MSDRAADLVEAIRIADRFFPTDFADGGTGVVSSIIASGALVTRSELYATVERLRAALREVAQNACVWDRDAITAALAVLGETE